MGQAQLYPERIIRIKERMQELGWSRQKIADEIEKAGDISSLASVKRVCSKGAENCKFKDITLQPIEKALGLLDEVQPPAMSKATEEFYHNIIRELNAQLKESRKVHQAKNIALVFLVGLQFILLVLDRINPDVGWYQPGANTGWTMIATLFACFCVVALGYLLYKRSAAKDDDTQSEA